MVFANAQTKRTGNSCQHKTRDSKQKSVKQQYETVCDLSAKEFTKVFWIVDLDSFIKEDMEASKGQSSPLKAFVKYRAMLRRSNPNVVVVVNNPCLEFWFLLHFNKTSKYFETCSGVETELKRHITNYEKSRKFFTRQNDDIYLKLKPHLNTAIDNSSALGHFDNDNPKRAMCEMALLFQSDELREYFR